MCDTQKPKEVDPFFTFHLLHGGQFAFPQIVECLGGGWLELAGVLAHAGGRGVTALTHAGMVTKSTLVDVRMGQRIDHGYSFVLWS